MCLANAHQLHVRLYSGRVSLVRCTSDWCREPQRSPHPVSISRIIQPYLTPQSKYPIPSCSLPPRSPLNPADSPSASQTPGVAYASDSPSKSHIGTRPFACWPCGGQSTQRLSETTTSLRPAIHSQTYHAMLAPLPNSTVHLHPPRLLLHRKLLHRDRHPRPAAPAVQTCVVSWCEGALGEGSDLGRGDGGERQGAHRGEEGSLPEGLGEEREEGHGGGCGGVAWRGLGWSLIKARLEMEARKIEDWRSRAEGPNPGEEKGGGFDDDLSEGFLNLEHCEA